MCGVLGSISNISLDYDKGIETIRHRGPDFNDKFKFKNLTLAHTRLSIIDLDSKSNQPFTIGTKTIIFNGEIYNYLSLKKILIEEGCQFKTEGYTEVLLQWIIRRGIESINKVEGMFALHYLMK